MVLRIPSDALESTLRYKEAQGLTEDPPPKRCSTLWPATDGHKCDSRNALGGTEHGTQLDF